MFWHRFPISSLKLDFKLTQMRFINTLGERKINNPRVFQWIFFSVTSNEWVLRFSRCDLFIQFRFIRKTNKFFPLIICSELQVQLHRARLFKRAQRINSNNLLSIAVLHFRFESFHWLRISFEGFVDKRIFISKQKAQENENFNRTHESSCKLTVCLTGFACHFASFFWFIADQFTSYQLYIRFALSCHHALSIGSRFRWWRMLRRLWRGIYVPLWNSHHKIGLNPY